MVFFRLALYRKVAARRELHAGVLHGRRPMVEIRVGYELIYDCPQPTPMMLVLNIHYTGIRHSCSGSGCV